MSDAKTSSAKATTAVETKAKFDIGALCAKAAPYAHKAVAVIEKIIPEVVNAWAKLLVLWERLQPYHPQEWAPAIFGLFLVFFGGRFLSTIAAAEAIRLMGFDRFLSHFRVLWNNYQTGASAAKKDEQEAAGKAEAEDKSIRTLKIILKSVDPKQVTEAIAGIYEIVLAVIATLRLKFAAAVTLGCSMGDMFNKAAEEYARPHLERLISPEYHKWIEPSIRYSCKAIGVSLAWVLQRVMSALHCSLRGAQLLVLSGQAAAVKLKLISKPLILETSPYFSLVVSAIAALGFLNQVMYGFGLPFPLSLVFLPVYILEWIITECIGIV